MSAASDIHGMCKLHAPVERLAVDDVHEDQAHRKAERESDGEPDRAHDEAFGREHRGDLPPRHAEVAQHAELAPAREDERAERRRESREADHDRHREQRIRHRERAIEDAQRERADLARRGKREARSIGKRGIDALAQLRRGRVLREPDRDVGGIVVAGHRDVGRTRDHDRPLLARVVAPHARHDERARRRSDRNVDARARSQMREVRQCFAHPRRRGIAVAQGVRIADERQAARSRIVLRQVAREQRNARPRRVEQHALHAQERNARNARHRRDGALLCRRQERGVAGGCPRARTRPRAARARASRRATGGTTPP